jgi:hypothetical protein
MLQVRFHVQNVSWVNLLKRSQMLVKLATQVHLENLLGIVLYAHLVSTKKTKTQWNVSNAQSANNMYLLEQSVQTAYLENLESQQSVLFALLATTKMQKNR